MIEAISRKTVTVSQRARRCSENLGLLVSTVTLLVSDTVRGPLSQFAGQSPRQEGVEADREQQQRAVDRLLPERVDLQDHERRADRPQQQRAERRAVDRSGAAEDRDAAD